MDWTGSAREEAPEPRPIHDDRIRVSDPLILPTGRPWRSLARRFVECSRSTPSVNQLSDLHLNGLGLRLLRLREVDFEHAVLVLGHDPVAVRVFRHREAPGEPAIRPLHA